jgi:GAF domain-containing protein
MEYTLHHTGVMSLAAFREQYPEHPFGPVMWEAGLREFMFTPLVTGGRTLGVLFFDAEQEGAYTPKHLALFQTIADQVAVAVANILANEDILAREREKTLLLQISEALAEARTRPELLQITLDQLRTVLPFADAGLFEVRPDGSHRDLTVDDQLDGMPTAAAISQAGLSGFLPPHPAVAEFMQEPRIRSLAWLLEHCPGHPHFPYLLGAGLRELIGGPLVHNGRPLGMLCFWAREEGFFHPRQLPLFKQLLSLVGTTMATILAHEEILARGQEKAQLLRISSALVTIQDRRQLFRVIYEDIRPIFPYESAGLFVVDPLGQTHYELTDENILDSEDERRLEAEVGRGPFPHPGSVVEYFMQQAGSALYDLTELAETHPHPQIPLMLETGYRQLIAGPLMKGGRAFGMVCFNAKQPDFYSAQDLPLFQAIAEQLAVVVANILANEEILEREREKTQLLKVSEAISTIRDAKSLFSSLSDIIQSIIAFDEAPMIFLLDEQSQYYRIFYSKVFDPSANLSSLDAWQQGKNLVATDAIATYLIKQNHALVLNLQQALEQWRDFPGKQTMLDLALRECLVAPLRVKDSLTGFLCVWSRSEGKFEIPKLNLFQAIADQVAVAVANILANEEILAREREKQQLLLISNDLANVRTREDFWPVLNRRIAHVFGESDTATLYLLKPDGRLFFAAQHKHEDFILEHPLLVAAQGPDGSLAVEGTPFEQILAADGAFTETVTQWAQRYPSFWGLEMCRLVKIEQLILAPLRYQGKTVGCWLLGNQDGYGLKDQELFQAVTDQLSVAVANILANEELASQAQEKALQVAVTEALHRGNTWEDPVRSLGPHAAAVRAVRLRRHWAQL